MSRDKKELNYNKEKWMEIEYYKEKFNYFPLIDISNFDLGYPMKNLFIPENFELIDFKQYNINPNDFKYPKKIIDSYHTIYYKPDIEFKIPKVYISCICTISNLNLNYDTFKNYSNLLLNLLEEELSEEYYFGELSDNTIKFSFNFNKINIDMIGFSDTIENFTKVIFNKVQILKDITKIKNINNKLLIKLKDAINILENKKLDSVDEQSNYKFSKFLRTPYQNYKNQIVKYKEILKYLNEKNLIEEDFISFINNLFSKTKFEWLIQGNIEPKKSLNFINYLEKEIKNWSNSPTEKKILTINEIRKKRIAKIEKNIFIEEIIENTDFEDENNCLLTYFQIGKIDLNLKEDLKKLCLLKLIEQIFYEDFYDELRTEQQIGYDVSIIIFPLFKIYGLNCYIQSTKFSPKEIQIKLNKFFIDFSLDDDEKFSQEDFESYKLSLINILKEKDLNLSNEFERNFHEISEREYFFNKNEKMIKCLENQINKEDVVNFFKDFIYEKSQRIDVGIYSKKNNNKMDVENFDDDENEDLPSFINSNKINVNNIVYFDEMFF